MKLVLHLMAADVRRFRSTFAAWTGLILIMSLVRALIPTVALNDALWVWLGFASALLELAFGLFFAGLVAVVVQAHSLVGTTAFWLARPIPPRTLMLSKALLLLIALVAFPALIDVAVMARHRVPADLMVLVVAQSVLGQSLAIAVLMGIASLTPNLTRFALVCIGVIISAVLLTSIWFTVMITRENAMPRGFDVSQGGGPVPVAMRVVDWTPHVIAALLIIAACGTLLLQQYTTRSWPRSAITGIIGLCLAGLLTSIVPWRILVPRQTVPEWAAAAAPVLSVDPASAQFNGSGRRAGSWAIADAEAHLYGVPTSWYATARLDSATLAIPGKPPLVSPSYGYSAALSAAQDPESPLTRVLGDALDIGDVDSSGTASLNRVFLMISPQPEVDVRRGLSGTYTGNFIVDLTQMESAGTVPLTGGIFQDRDFRIVVDPRGPPGSDYGFELSARLSRSRSMFDRRPPREYLYFLRNRARGQAISGFNSSMPEMNPLGNLPVDWLRSAFAVRAITLRFNVPRDRANPRSADQAWLADAELVIVRATGVGSVPRQVRFDGLTVGAGRGAKMSGRQ